MPDPLHRARRAAMKPAFHRQLWRLVEGGVVDALKSHPEYLTAAGRMSAVQSITKRVVGQVVGHVMQAQERGRLPAAGGSRGDAEESGVAEGTGQGILPSLSRTRMPDLHGLLCGDGPGAEASHGTS